MEPYRHSINVNWLWSTCFTSKNSHPTSCHSSTSNIRLQKDSKSVFKVWLLYFSKFCFWRQEDHGSEKGYSFKYTRAKQYCKCPKPRGRTKLLSILKNRKNECCLWQVQHYQSPLLLLQIFITSSPSPVLFPAPANTCGAKWHFEFPLWINSTV